MWGRVDDSCRSRSRHQKVRLGVFFGNLSHFVNEKFVTPYFLVIIVCWGYVLSSGKFCTEINFFFLGLCLILINRRPLNLNLLDPLVSIFSLATASHWPSEGGKGATFVSLNGILMQAYMDRYKVHQDDFAPWALTAHANAQHAAHAVFKGKPLDFKTYSSADTITGPVKVGVNY